MLSALSTQQDMRWSYRVDWGPAMLIADVKLTPDS